MEKKEISECLHPEDILPIVRGCVEKIKREPDYDCKKVKYCLIGHIKSEGKHYSKAEHYITKQIISDYL